MSKYRKKPVVVEAITFDELVAHGRSQVGDTHGMPWAFDYAGHPITHETDDCYLIPTLEGTMQFRRGDQLITGVAGEIYPCKPDIFAATYEDAAADDRTVSPTAAAVVFEPAGTTMNMRLIAPEGDESAPDQTMINAAIHALQNALERMKE